MGFVGQVANDGGGWVGASAAQFACRKALITLTSMIEFQLANF
jgi:hypothetical protein